MNPHDRQACDAKKEKKMEEIIYRNEPRRELKEVLYRLEYTSTAYGGRKFVSIRNLTGKPDLFTDAVARGFAQGQGALRLLRPNGRKVSMK